MTEYVSPWLIIVAIIADALIGLVALEKWPGGGLRNERAHLLHLIRKQPCDRDYVCGDGGGDIFFDEINGIEKGVLVDSSVEKIAFHQKLTYKFT